MSSIKISLIAFALIFSGAILGFLLRRLLPVQHLSNESRDIVKLGMGLVATVSALVLGLLVASAKSSFDTQSTELTQTSAKIIVLDRVLAHYGDESKEARDLLKKVSVQVLDHMWGKDTAHQPFLGGPAVANEVLFEKIQALSPSNDEQRTLKAQSVNLIMELVELRWLMFAQRTASVSPILLGTLVFWLSIIFISYGVFAPRNLTVFISTLFAALAVSGAILLILEMSAPYSGLIQVSNAPLQSAISRMGQ